jgi:uncharacterized membrane protein YvbJ
MTPEFCPECGAEVPEGATACPECGSCEETGWSEHATASRLGIPDDSFDYDRYLREEFGPEPAVPKFRRWIIPLTVVLLAVLLILGWLL